MDPPAIVLANRLYYVRTPAHIGDRYSFERRLFSNFNSKANNVTEGGGSTCGASRLLNHKLDLASADQLFDRVGELTRDLYADQLIRLDASDRAVGELRFKDDRAISAVAVQ
jgi:hypothetical protein